MHGRWDLKAATAIRSNEAGDFAAEEIDLKEIIGLLDCAIGILQKEMQKRGASMLQLKNAGAQTLKTMVQASVVCSADSTRLTSLVQSSGNSADESDEFGAPDAAVYQGHSASIIEILEDLWDKAEAH